MDTSFGTAAPVSGLTGDFCYQSELVGQLRLKFGSGFLKSLVYSESEEDVAEQETQCLPLGHPVAVALDAYFSGDPSFSVLLHRIPLDRLAGTPFQKRVREALLSIPYGETRSYGHLAETLGSSPRAVGQSCRRNPVAIIVPCHRVILSSMEPGGYGGKRKGGVWERKLALLRHEGVPS